MTHVANVTIQSSQVSADATDFVFYVDLSDLPTTEFWGTVANGGGDIRVFKSDGTTELARDVVSCDTATDTGGIWVKFSGTLSSSVDTTVQIHADGTSSDYAVTDTYGRNAVWSSYGAVYHMQDSSPTTSIADSSGNGRDMVTSDGSLTSVSDGVIGKAVNFPASSYAYADDESLTEAAPFTLQVWMRTPSGNSQGGVSAPLFFIGDKNTGIDYVHLSEASSGGFKITQQYNRGYTSIIDSNNSLTSSFARMTTGWHLFTGVFDFNGTNNVYTAYFDYGLANTKVSAGTGPYRNHDRIGLNAALDSSILRSIYDPHDYAEVRLYEGELSAERIATEYNNQSAPNTFYTIAAVSAGGPTVSPFGMQILGQQFGPIAAARLNGVMQ